MSEAWDAETFLARLRDEGGPRYHDRHPFHVRMHEGRLTPVELRAWVENRYYYQTRIPLKDALILSKAEDPAFRRRWIRRIHEQDGTEDGTGGIADWERLAQGLGVDLRALRSFSRVLPAVRFACDAYVALVRESPLVVAVAASLTELFSPALMAARLAAWERHYPWVDRAALAYFRTRIERAKVDSDEAISFVLAHAITRELQERCVDALVRKAEILWAILDAIERAPREEER